MRVVLDTNVLVSALLTPHGSPAQLLRLMLQGDLAVLYDDRIIAEYREVLSRPKFGFGAKEIGEVIGQLERTGETVLARPVSIELPDRDDLPFLEVAISGSADALVTGNPRHFRPVRGDHGVEIASPGEIVKRVAAQGPSSS